MRNICLTLEYDGTAYHGWQRQREQITVQQVLEDALSDLFAAPITVNGCGRTDAGVHALNYCCNFFADTSIECRKIVPAVNVRLPDDIRIKLARDADDNFHARFSVKQKQYMYKITNTPVQNVFMRNYAWHYKYPLNIELMQQASLHMLGEHDFTAFASSDMNVSSTVRTIYSIDISKNQDNIISIHVCGNGFLYNMVRIITGTLVYCGCGKIPPESVADIIASADRTKAGITAPPQGLYMEKVIY